MLRALREIVAAPTRLPLRAGVNRGHVFTGDIGGAPAHLRGDGRRRQPRRAAHGAGEARRDPRDGRRARPRAHDLRDREEPLLVKGKEHAVMAHTRR